MFKLIFGIRALLVSAFLVLAFNVLQSIYIPTIALEKGMTAISVGFLGSFYFLGFVTGCLFLPRFLYAVGHIRVFSSFAAISAISTLIISITSIIEVWIASRFVTGICLAALYMSIESWVGGFSTDKNRGRILSIYRLVDIVGCLAGQSLLFFSYDFPYILQVVAIGFLVSFLPLSLTKVQPPILMNAGPERLLSVAKIVFSRTPLGIYGVLLSGFASGIFWSLLPVFSEANSLNEVYNPIFVISYLSGGAIIQWPLGVLSDRFDRRIIIIFSSLIALLSCWGLTALILCEFSMSSILVVFMFLIGAGSIPLYSLSLAHSNDGVAKESMVKLSVLLLVMSSLGSVLGPFLFGINHKFINSKYVFVYSAMAYTLLFFIGIYYLITKNSIQQANKKLFMFLSRASSLVVATSQDNNSDRLTKN